MEFTLRRLESLDDYKACERLQGEVWGFSDGVDIIPQTQMVTAQKWGGLVLGAFDDDGALRGFCYGFLGRDGAGRLVHCSHMLAVDENARNAGLGAMLKWAQREVVREQGIGIMVWTFDPLESINACLNFDKLGGQSDCYEVNLYGETTSRLHAGTATDRLTLKWFLDSPRVEARMAGRRDAICRSLVTGDIGAPWALRADGLAPGAPRLDLDAHRVRCEIPISVQRIKEGDPEAAVAWRRATRAVFQEYFGRGYFARECVHIPVRPGAPDLGASDAGAPDPGNAAPRTVYLFEKGDLEADGLQE